MQQEFVPCVTLPYQYFYTLLLIKLFYGLYQYFA